MEINREYIQNRIRELQEFKAKLERDFYAAEAVIGELLKQLEVLEKEENEGDTQ